jgi:hypothetical protein
MPRRIASKETDQWIDLILKDLRDQKQNIETVIALLQELEGLGDPTLHTPRRGRKSMNAAERQAVSARIKRYWGTLRAQKAELKPQYRKRPTPGIQ